MQRGARRAPNGTTPGTRASGEHARRGQSLPPDTEPTNTGLTNPRTDHTPASPGQHTDGDATGRAANSPTRPVTASHGPRRSRDRV